MIVRPAESADDIAKLVAIAQLVHRESNFRDMKFCPSECAEQLTGYTRNHDRLALLAEGDDGQIHGGLLASLHQSDFGPDHIACDQGLYVLPSRRGGIAGKRLVAAYVDWARARGAQRINFDVRTGIQPARAAAFLAKLGFEPIGVCMIYTR